MNLLINDLSSEDVLTSYNFARNSDIVFSETVTHQEFDQLNKDNDLDKFLPQILSIFKNLPMHWSSLNKESKIKFKKLIFPEGISYTLEEKITTLQIFSLLTFTEKILSRKVIWWS